MITKQKIGNELYVWINGKLLYKRWLDKDYGIVFDLHGVFRPKVDFSHSIKDKT